MAFLQLGVFCNSPGLLRHSFNFASSAALFSGAIYQSTVRVSSLLAAEEGSAKVVAAQRDRMNRLAKAVFIGVMVYHFTFVAGLRANKRLSAVRAF